MSGPAGCEPARQTDGVASVHSSPPRRRPPPGVHPRDAAQRGVAGRRPAVHLGVFPAAHHLAAGAAAQGASVPPRLAERCARGAHTELRAADARSTERCTRCAQGRDARPRGAEQRKVLRRPLNAACLVECAAPCSPACCCTSFVSRACCSQAQAPGASPSAATALLLNSPSGCVSPIHPPTRSRTAGQGLPVLHQVPLAHRRGGRGGRRRRRAGGGHPGEQGRAAGWLLLSPLYPVWMDWVWMATEGLGSRRRRWAAQRWS